MSLLAELSSGFVPNINRGYREALRFQHKDLCELDDCELWRERERAAFLAAWLSEDEGRDWCEQRVKKVMAEQAKRRKHRGKH